MQQELIPVFKTLNPFLDNVGIIGIGVDLIIGESTRDPLSYG